MKNMIFKITSFVLVFTLVFAIPVPIFADTVKYANSLGLAATEIVNASSMKIVNNKGIYVTVDIQAPARGKLTVEQIKEFADAVENENDKITIYDIVYPDETFSTASVNNTRSYTDLHIYPATSVTKLESDRFIISVAKGQVITLTESLTESYSLQLASSFDASLGIDIVGLKASLGSQTTSMISMTVSVTEQFSGPPEGSEYNSREFRVKFYHRYRDFRITVNGEYEFGHFWEPMYHARYSIDKTIN